MALLPHSVTAGTGTDAPAPGPEGAWPAEGPVPTEALSVLPPAGTRYWRIRNWSANALPTPRDLFVWLPEAYLAEPGRRFPMLLMHDGQNLFDGDLAYVKGSTWRAGEAADREIAAGRAEPLVLVGVGNTGAERMPEYTPTPDTRLGGGKGPLYAKALVDELLPVLHRDLRLQTEPAATGIAGSSLGGLISLAIALQYPQVFGKVGVLSPSIWWDSRAVLDEVRLLPAKLPLRVWLDIGTSEGAVHLRDADLLVHLLQRKGWVADGPSAVPRPSSSRAMALRRPSSPLERYPATVPGAAADLHYERVPFGVHNEAAWAERLPRVLSFLFPL